MKRIRSRIEGRSIGGEPSLEEVLAHLQVLDELIDEIVSRANNLLTSTDEREVSNAAATVAIDGARFGVHYITQTAGAALEVRADETFVPIADWPIGMMLNVLVRNTTGGNLAVSFSADFGVSGAVVADGGVKSWLIRVAPPGWPVRLQEV